MERVGLLTMMHGMPGATTASHPICANVPVHALGSLVVSKIASRRGRITLTPALGASEIWPVVRAGIACGSAWVARMPVVWIASTSIVRQPFVSAQDSAWLLESAIGKIMSDMQIPNHYCTSA